MDKTPGLIISNWQGGISPSAFTGFADMRNVDIASLPGLLSLNYATGKKSASNITGSPKWFARDTDANNTLYVLDSSGKVYSASTSGGYYASWAQVAGNTTTSASGNGMAIWHDYLFVARDALIDVYGPLSSSPSWTNGWAGATGFNSDTLTHPMLVATSDMLYIGNGQDTTNKLGPALASLQQVAGKIFAPGDATTYTWNATALRLPYQYQIRCIAQLANNLMVGTIRKSSTETHRVADIFPWDRTSATFSLPIRLSEAGVNQLLTINNQLYIQAGNKGRFYVYNGYLAQPLFSVPVDGPLFSTTIAYQVTQTAPGAIMYHRGRLFFGISAGDATNGTTGVYSVNLDGSGLILENTVSTGSNSSNVIINCLFPLRELNGAYAIGWQDSDASAQGVDLVGQDNFATSYTGYADSQIYQIGAVIIPSQMQHIEIYLDRPLQTNEGVRVSARTSTAASYTTLVTFDYATYTGKQSLQYPIGPKFSVDTQAQFRILLTGTTTSPRVKYVRIY